MAPARTAQQDEMDGGSRSTARAPRTAKGKRADEALRQGLEAHRRGDLDTAERYYRTVLGLDPGSAIAQNDLGVLLFQRGQLGPAEELIRSAAVLKPDYAEAHANLGTLLRQKGEVDAAIAAFEQAVAAKPDYADAHANLASALEKKGDHDAALVAADRALAIRADHAEAQFARGNVFLAKKQTEEAIEAYRAAVASKPGYAEAHARLGLVLMRTGELDEAIAAYRHAIAPEPRNPEPYYNLGVALAQKNETEAAIAEFRQALALAPDWAHPHFGLSLVLLQKGDYAEGWREYEWRWKGAIDKVKPRELPKPQWRGEDLAGKTLLLYAEQGLGDTLQFVRFVPGLSARGGRVVLEVPGKLLSLLRMSGAAENLLPAGAPLPEFDFHLPLLSLPAVTGFAEETIPAEMPYLGADPARVALWHERIAAGGFRVGVVWQGFPNADIDKGRSIPLRAFAPLAAVPGVRLISLQKNYGLDQLDDLPEGMRVETLGADFDSGPDAFLDTAAVMAELDLVITSDTSIGHLAGALGRPVWIVLKTNPDWRWLQDREDSAWYPTARLFRQKKRGDWDEVMARVAEELARAAGGNRESLCPPGKMPPAEAWAERGRAAFDRGFTMQKEGKLREAAEAYCKAITIDPNHAEAYSNLGVIRHAHGRIDDAIVLYRRALALKPDHVSALGNLVQAATAKGDLDGAIAGLRQLLATKPGDAENQTRLGDLLRRKGDVAGAIAAYRDAAAFKPDDAKIQFNYAFGLQAQGEIEAAVAGYRRAIALDPDLAQAHANLGVALVDGGRLDEGIACCREAVRLRPDSAQYHSNLGLAMSRADDLEAALDHYRRAVALDPDHAEAHTNLGLALVEVGEVDEAIACHRRAIEVKPDFAQGHFDLALALLLAGDFAAGWREYEWRWKGGVKKLQPQNFSQPQWQGEAVTGKTLLLHTEQGLGDMLQFARFAPEMAARGTHVVLAVPRELTALLGTMPGSVTVVGSGERLPRFDFHLPLMSVPALIGAAEEAIPAAVPYLRADPDRVVRWRERLPADGFKIGVVWQGRPDALVDKGRSIPLRALTPLAALAGVRLVSLQKNHGLDQLDGLPHGMRVVTLGAEFDAGPDAFLDTAAAMMSLDLIVTSDTSVAHLAGALGRPVWIALKRNPDWRWLLDRDDSPWYPTARLFRQRRRGDWESVFATMASELAQVIAGDRARLGPPKRANAESAVVALRQSASEAGRDHLAGWTVSASAAPHASGRIPVVFNWGMSPSLGWGIFGLHMALRWASDPDLLPVCAAAIDAGELSDPLRRRILAPVVKDSLVLQGAMKAWQGKSAAVPHPMLHGLRNGLFDARTVHDVSLRGTVNVGLPVIEDTTVDEAALERAKHYSLLIAASTWNKEVLAAKGVATPLELVLLGIDPAAFHPGAKSGLFKDRFVIFSGGKLEHRKGQDLVLLAFRAFRQRHPEALLVTAWHSPWPRLAATLAANPRVAPVPVSADRVDPSAWAAANGIPAEAFLDLGPVPNWQMPLMLRECDVGLFANRAEGGTNLVAMEAMACGVPCILSANTGHLDLIRAGNCLPLGRQAPVTPVVPTRETEGWGESDVDEMVEALEALWQDRGRAERIGRAGAMAMAALSWAEQIARLKQVLMPHFRALAVGERG